MDNTFGIAVKGQTLWYDKHHTYLPELQAKLLYLWDELGIPHKFHKQLSAQFLTIIGNKVDVCQEPNPKGPESEVGGR